VTVRFLADENLDTDIIQGLRAREPSIDILDVKTAWVARSRGSSAARARCSAGSRLDHLRPEHDDAKRLASAFKIGADATVTAGPVRRDSSISITSANSSIS
jgi:hypothetical protein